MSLLKVNSSMCSDCSAVEPTPPQEEFDTIGRFIMHKSLREFPVLVESLEVVSFFLDITHFKDCVSALLYEIAQNPLNKYSERLVHLRFFFLHGLKKIIALSKM
jgi:hypothetical protein